MKSKPNPIGFVVMIGLVVAMTNTLSARPGQHLTMLIAGLIVTALLAAIVAIALAVRSRLQRRQSRG